MSAVKGSQQFPNISLYPTVEYSELFPKNLNELQSLVKDALKNETKLYPISTGFNWGMGSKIPTDNECKIVNLSSLTEIIEYDKFSGTVIIEPGVTQYQLMQFLLENGNQHYIDVTGSSKDTSIIGNALERGITYNTQRNESIIGLEVLTGKAEILRTGSWRFKNSKIQNTYKHGVGANLTELFFQSNFGIVTKIIIKLQKVKKYNYSILIEFDEIKNVSGSMEAFNKLIENNTINSIFHIANSERAQGVILPAIQQRLMQINCKYSLEDIKKTMNSMLKSGWLATGFISSNEKIDIKHKAKELKKTLSKYGKIKIIDINKLKFLNRNIRIFSKLNIFKIAYGAYPFKALYLGKPTDAALGSVVELKDYLKKDFSAHDVDKSEIGFAYCLPLLPMDNQNCTKVYELTTKICSEYNFRPSITLNPIKENLLEAVISIEYKKDNYKESRACIRKLQISLNKNGYYSYRTNIKDMDLYFDDPLYLDYLKGIKKVFDPMNIISPGRYLPQEKIKIQR